MNLPEQFSLRDFVIHFLFGTVILSVLGLFTWHFFQIDVLEILNNGGAAATLLGFILAYLIGILFSTSLFAFLLKISIQKNPKLFFKVIRKILFGIDGKTDGRTNPFVDSDELNKKTENFVKDLFSVDFVNTDEKTRKNVFYIVYRYIECEAGQLPVVIERKHVRTNFFASMIAAFLFLTILNLTAILLKIIFNFGELPLLSLFIIQGTSFWLVRNLTQKFQSNLLNWWKNIWRTLIALQSVSK